MEEPLSGHVTKEGGAFHSPDASLFAILVELN